MNRKLVEKVEILILNEEDAVRIAEMEQAVFPDPWSLKSLQETLVRRQYVNLGAWKDGNLVGYLLFSYVLDEGEIVRVAVAPEMRRAGVATALLLELEQLCEEMQIGKVMLDVREHNEAARAFYLANGFKQDGVRKNFYGNPPEDAVLMSRCSGKQMAGLSAVPTRN